MTKIHILHIQYVYVKIIFSFVSILIFNWGTPFRENKGDDKCRNTHKLTFIRKVEKYTNRYNYQVGLF